MKAQFNKEKFKKFNKKYGFIGTINKYYKNFIDNKYAKIENKRYQKWIKINEPTKIQLDSQKDYQFSFLPKISIIVPMYNTKKRHFKELIESVKNQTYTNWEICIADGSDKEEEYIQQIIETDEKIKYIKLNENKGIAENSNQALTLATGDYLAFLDHDDVLSDFALFEVVKTINENRNVKWIYSDEDKIIDNSNKRVNPNFKPDFAIDTLLSYNYICHFSVFEKEFFNELKGFNKEYEGSQDYDLFLRAAEKTNQIIHIPKILYHWRINDNSVASNPEVKNFAFENGKKAIEDYLKRNNIKGEVETNKLPGTYKINYEPIEKPKVSVIIPNINCEDINKKIDDIINNTSYDNYEIVIVQDKNKKVIQNSLIKTIIYNNHDKNESNMFNIGAQKATGEFLIFYNEKIDIQTYNWIEILLGHFQREEVGIVGTKIVTKDLLVKNSGIVLNKTNSIIKVNSTLSENDSGYMARNIITQNFNCVTDLIMIKRKDFESINGFDNNYSKDNKYIDLCLKVREKDKLIVMNPHIKCYTTNSMFERNNKKENTSIKRKWEKYFSANDMYYNENLKTNLMQVRLNDKKERTKIKVNEKNSLFVLLNILLFIIFFMYNVVITFDTSHYLWLTSLLSEGGNFAEWDVARGPIFPLFIRICNIFTGRNQGGLRIAMYIFYVIMLVGCYLIYKNTIKNEKYHNKRSKSRALILFIIFIALNPIIFGYYHVLLTEFIAVTLAVISCYISWKLIYINLNDNRKKFLIYTIVLAVLTPLAWLLKQPYVGTVIFPVIISAVISFVRQAKIKNLLQRLVTIIACVVMLVVGLKTWDLAIKVGNVKVEGTRTSGGFLSNGILSGIKFYDVLEDETFDTIKKIDDYQKITAEDKEKMKKVLNKESEYKYFKVINTNQEYYLVLYSTTDSISVDVALKLWFETLAEDPGRLINNYILNYLGTTSILKIEFDGMKIKILNDIDYVATVEIGGIAGKTFEYGDTNVFDLSTELEPYAKDYRRINKPLKIVNNIMKLLMLVCSFFMKLAYLILPFGTIISIIAVFRTKNRYYITYTRIIDMITILFSFSLLHILIHSMLGSTIDRYTLPALIPTFIGIYLSVYALKNRKKYRLK